VPHQTKEEKRWRASARSGVGATVDGFHRSPSKKTKNNEKLKKP
jgi:hypothetical protein